MDLYCVRLAIHPSKSSRGRGQEKRSKTYLSCTRNRKFNLEADSYSAAWKKWKLELPERDAIFKNWSVLSFSLYDVHLILFVQNRTHDTHMYRVDSRSSRNSNNPILEHCETENTLNLYFLSTLLVISKSLNETLLRTDGNALMRGM